jgi:hypothetical protein
MGCAHADWKRTAKGALHPSKVGRCGYVYLVPALPNSRYFISTPIPCGGFIYRDHAYANDCPYYREEARP